MAARIASKVHTVDDFLSAEQCARVLDAMATSEFTVEVAFARHGMEEGGEDFRRTALVLVPQTIRDEVDDLLMARLGELSARFDEQLTGFDPVEFFHYR